jgi:hypothetical protein
VGGATSAAAQAQSLPPPSARCPPRCIRSHAGSHASFIGDELCLALIHTLVSLKGRPVARHDAGRI